MSKFIVWLVFSFLSTFAVFNLYNKLCGLEKKVDLKVKVFFILGVIVIAFAECYHLEFFSSILYFIFFPCLFYLMNKLPIKKLFYYVFIVWFYGIVADIFTILFTSLIFFIFNINNNIYINYSDKVSILLSLCVSFFLIVLSKIKKVKDLTDKIYLKIDNIKYFDFLLAIFAIFILTMAIVMFMNVQNLDINLLIIIVLIMMIVTFIILLKYKINYEENLKYLKTLKENNEFYIKMEDENRIFKHNLIAKLLSIKSVANKKAISLIEDLISQFNKSIDFSNSIKIIPYGLNGIVYQKLYPYLKKINIKINNEINYDIFNVLKPRRYNVLVEKVVIALDNAIESSLHSKSKNIVINMCDVDDCILIEIQNTFGNDINLDLLGNINYSTKGKKHGLGLFSIMRNNEASVSVKIVNNTFISKIKAKKKAFRIN